MKVIRAKGKELKISKGMENDDRKKQKEENRKREKNMKGERCNKKHSKVLRGCITCQQTTLVWRFLDGCLFNFEMCGVNAIFDVPSSKFAVCSYS